ncbi:FtsW/RodA/SpoVE family cell cycle protein [Eisenibacter elegans]|uniref:FtsW/RodA/SpoVE family cell cycle protein n=1 Tax=Eisenibacter elegans TaxID=997 RepID=UPI0004791CB1|nr:FtsW/RodA/SpoVE family cell cycle protein [Eisenibacter elegans]
MRVINQSLQGDRYVWLVVVALSLMSILVVYSATGTLAYKKMQGNTEYYLLKHGALVALSLLVMWVAHQIDYRYYAKLSRLALLASVPLLLISWRFGVNINEASRWITIPLINQSFQPSDLAKLALISHVAAMLARSQRNMQDFQQSIQPVLIWIGVICMLIGLSNISNALLLFFICVVLMFIGRVPIQYLLMLGLIGGIAVMMALMMGQRMETALSRVQKFTDTEEVHFQAQQSYIAIATGGFLGKGPGNSDQRNFLPHPYSDFIYAIIIEEYGFVGGVMVLFLYLTLLYRGVMIAANSRRVFGSLLAVGLTFSLVFQALLNMCVSVGLVPITGVPMPMLSMGGTSLLFTGLAIGILLSISRGELDPEIDQLARSSSANTEE